MPEIHPVGDWVRGDLLGLEMPAHALALGNGGPDFLTAAFRAAGALPPDNAVAEIRDMRECPGGSTGRKLFLTLRYAKPAPELQQELFVKFSRDFDNAIRDRARDQLAPEVKLSLLSRAESFPITVPTCYFADYHHASGTGLLITQSIPFGEDGLEPLYEKCLDWQMPEPLAHYRVIVKALAQLAGAHKAGCLGSEIEAHFPFEPDAQVISQPIRYDEGQLLRRVDRLREFAADYPRLLSDNVRNPAFLEQMRADIPVLLEYEQHIKKYLHSDPGLIALIHWNANVDNAWFWRDDAGELTCGLIDWGGVGQMNVAMALWGALSAAETSLWDDYFDELLILFIGEYAAAGGPRLDLETLREHVLLTAVMMGLAWLMDAPAMILRALPDLAPSVTRRDPLFVNNESARTQLQMLTNVLNLWQHHGPAELAQRIDQA